MTHDPARLCDDPAAPAALRRALRAAAAAPPVSFDPAAGLAQLRAAVRAEGTAGGVAASPTASPSAAPVAAQGAPRVAFRHATWWGVAAVGLASLLAMMPGLSRRTRAAPARDARVELAPHAGASDAEPDRTETARPDAPRTPSAAPARNARTAAPHARRGDSAAPSASPRTLPDPLAPRRGVAGSLALRPGIAAPTLRAAPAPAPAPAASRPLREALAQPFADMLDNERRRLEWGYAELAHNPRRALALCNERPLQFYGNQHREEWDSLAIRALVRLGRRDEARSRGRAYLARFPHGPSSGFIRELVGQRPDDDG